MTNEIDQYITCKHCRKTSHIDDWDTMTFNEQDELVSLENDELECPECRKVNTDWKVDDNPPAKQSCLMCGGKGVIENDQRKAD